MQISYTTRSAPGGVNEDYVVAGPDWAVVLDGATPVPGAHSGCRHGVPWLVRRLAAGLSRRLTLAKPAPGGTGGPAQGSSPRLAFLPLAELLADAIAETRDAHAGTCDLANPDTPSSTVSVVRVCDGNVEYLVLCDSPLLLGLRAEHLGQEPVLRIADERLARLGGGRPLSVDEVRAARNQPDGFWVASTDPEAAYQASRGSVGLDSVTDAALLTDGVTRLAEWYGYSLAEIFARLREAGPAGLIDLVRAAEYQSPLPAAKQHDDATAVHIRF